MSRAAPEVWRRYGGGADATALRLFATCWIVLTLHFATNFAREHYPALSLAETGSFRVDEYLGLHSDIFETPEGEAYINNNPGVSILAAVPLLVARPALAWAESLRRRELAESGGRVSAEYRTERRGWQTFYRQARERGLDLKFGLISFLTVAFCMSPLTALAGVVLLGTLRGLAVPRGEALFLSFLLVLGTPLFFRNGYLNHNHVLGLAVFFAFVLLWRVAPRSPDRRWPVVLAGFLGGFGVLCDYSGVVPLAFLGAYAALRAWAAPAAGAADPGWRGAVSGAGWFVAGAALPIAFLLAYQWSAFGSPFRPAQALMPPTEYSVHGYHGMTWPRADLIWANLFDPRFGLFAFGPILLLALPGLWLTPASWLSRAEKGLIAAFVVAFLLFCSANQFARLTWNTGMRYTMPLVPILFLLAIPALRRMPPLATYAAAVLAFAHAWALAMARESVPESLVRVFVGGFQLPWLTVIGRTSAQYAPWLEGAPSPLPLMALAAALIAGVWRFGGGGHPPDAPVGHDAGASRLGLPTHGSLDESVGVAGSGWQREGP
ncbi:MAG: hypothetical protein ABR599_08860 [Gemmatimonadota bacterium]